MRRIVITVLILLGTAAVMFWWTGGLDHVASWAAQHQRTFQNSMATTLRAVRAGHPGAVALLLTACFAYGFFHAVGPGHGKFLIGGYGVGRKVPMVRLSLISLAASLGQAVTAVVLVYAGILVLNMGREAMIGVTERLMAPVSYGAIALIGGWLVWRGARRVRGPVKQPVSVGIEDVCGSCGHSHGPSLAQVEKMGTWREAFAIICGVALRPCTGALFVLIITWQMGIAALGVLGAFAMALGTASVTITVGLAAVGVRGGIVTALAKSERSVQVMAGVEIAAGAAVTLLAFGLLMRAL